MISHNPLIEEFLPAFYDVILGPFVDFGFAFALEFQPVPYRKVTRLSLSEGLLAN
jgi:hypothetical protein